MSQPPPAEVTNPVLWRLATDAAAHHRPTSVHNGHTAAAVLPVRTPSWVAIPAAPPWRCR